MRVNPLPSSKTSSTTLCGLCLRLSPTEHMQTPYLFHDLSLLQQKKTAPNCTKLQQRTQTRGRGQPSVKKTSAAPTLPAELRWPPSPTSAPPASLPASPSSSAGGSSSAPPPSQPRRPSASTGLPGRPASAAICRAPAASLADERAARLSPRLAVVLRGARLPLNLAARAPSTGPPGRAAGRRAHLRGIEGGPRTCLQVRGLPPCQGMRKPWPHSTSSQGRKEHPGAASGGGR